MCVSNQELFVGPKLLRVAEMMASLTFPGFNFVDELEIEHRLFGIYIKPVLFTVYLIFKDI